MTRRLAGRVAGVVLVLLATGCTVLLGRVAAGRGRAALTGAPVPPEDALLGALALVGALVLLWLLLGAALEALARVPGAVGRAAERASAAVSPRVVRRAAALALGVGLGAGPSVGPALAASAHTVALVVTESVAGPAPLPDPGWSAPPDPGWTPTAPTVRRQPDVSVVSGRVTARDPGEVVVRRGDTLWSIAARHLGEGATDAEVAAAWPRWYAANRAVVGPDPDLLRPGQVLHAPEVLAP